MKDDLVSRCASAQQLVTPPMHGFGMGKIGISVWFPDGICDAEYGRLTATAEMWRQS
jgi:hypothetical protein